MPAEPPKRKRPTRKGQKKNWTPEGKQKLSELAKQRHAEGKMGGSKFGKLGGRGNTREKRLASQSIAEAAQEHAEDLLDVLKNGIHPDQPQKTRNDTLKIWTDIERDSKKIEMQEQRDRGEAMTREQLLAALRDRLTTGPSAGIIQKALEPKNDEIYDAVLVDEPETTHDG